MDGMEQLEQEIRRHFYMAQLTSGAVRNGHMEAARQLAALRDRIGGEEPRQESRSGSHSFSHLQRFFANRAALLEAKRFHGH